jgi:hypothetical protein
MFKNGMMMAITEDIMARMGEPRRTRSQKRRTLGRLALLVEAAIRRYI